MDMLRASQHFGELWKNMNGWRRLDVVFWLDFLAHCAKCWCSWRWRLSQSSSLLCSCLNSTVKKWSRDAWGRSETVCNMARSQPGQASYLSQCQESSNLPLSFVLGTFFPNPAYLFFTVFETPANIGPPHLI